MSILRCLSHMALPLIAGFVYSSVFPSVIQAETDEVKPRISLRQVTIKNAAYSSQGNFFAIPNYVTTGSVGIFKVAPDGNTVSVPARFSEKDFYRSRGVFYYGGKKDENTDMVFIPLKEYPSGYTVTFTNQGDTLAICGNDKITMYDAVNWSLTKTIDLKGVTRAVFSSDNTMLGAVADGRIYILKAPSFTVAYTIEPENGCTFADLSFSGDNRIVAAFEHKNQVLDFTPRIRLFTTDNGSIDRQLPWFSDKISTAPGNHYPLVSFLPSDSALAVSLEKNLFGKVAIINAHDGTIVREFKASCYAVSLGGSLFAAGGAVYNMSTWEKIGSVSNSARCMAFSHNSPYLLVITPEQALRLKVSLGK